MENKTVLPRLFASLSSLERSFEFLMDKLAERELIEEHRPYTKELSKILTKMRRTANLLQMSVAKNDVQGSFRLLNVFYGLNYMIRPELLQALDRLSSGESPVATHVEMAIESQLH